MNLQNKKINICFFGHFINNINFNYNFNQTPLTCFLLNNKFNHSFNKKNILIKLTTTKNNVLKFIVSQTTTIKITAILNTFKIAFWKLLAN